MKRLKPYSLAPKLHFRCQRRSVGSQHLKLAYLARSKHHYKHHPSIYWCNLAFVIVPIGNSTRFSLGSLFLFRKHVPQQTGKLIPLVPLWPQPFTEMS